MLAGKQRARSVGSERARNSTWHGGASIQLWRVMPRPGCGGGDVGAFSLGEGAQPLLAITTPNQSNNHAVK
jgi:hypothetical protein